MQSGEWHALLQSYHGTALRRAHDAQSDIEVNYWKQVAHELKRDMDLK